MAMTPPYYAPYTQPYYSQYQPQRYDWQYQQQLQQAAANQPVAPQINQPQPQQTPIIWVSGEAGAKSYLVAPNNTVMLMDAENSTFYLKSTDASGVPMPLRIFDYSERTVTPNPAVNAETNPQPRPEYVTRGEFEERLAALLAPSKNTVKKDKDKDGATNG